MRLSSVSTHPQRQALSEGAIDAVGRRGLVKHRPLWRRKGPPKRAARNGPGLAGLFRKAVCGRHPWVAGVRAGVHSGHHDGGQRWRSRERANSRIRAALWMPGICMSTKARSRPHPSATTPPLAPRSPPPAAPCPISGSAGRARRASRMSSTINSRNRTIADAFFGRWFAVGRRHRRQDETKWSRALPAFHPDFSTHQLDQPFADRQAEAGAAVLPRDRTVS